MATDLYYFKKMLEKYESEGRIVRKKRRYQIIINSDGKTTTATMSVKGKEIKHGTAKCSPKDRFNFKTGAELALQRMWDDATQGKETQNKESQHEPVKQVEAKETVRKGKWIPKENEFYWTIDACGNPSRSYRSPYMKDIFFDYIAYFETEQECQEYIDIHKDFKEKSFEPDWDDYGCCKFYFGYYNYPRIWGTYYRTNMKYAFRTMEICKELIEKWGEEKIAKYILEVY